MRAAPSGGSDAGVSSKDVLRSQNAGKVAQLGPDAFCLRSSAFANLGECDASREEAELCYTQLGDDAQVRRWREHLAKLDGNCMARRKPLPADMGIGYVVIKSTGSAASLKREEKEALDRAQRKLESPD